jgi:hypothetical protein
MSPKLPKPKGPEFEGLFDLSGELSSSPLFGVKPKLDIQPSKKVICGMGTNFFQVFFPNASQSCSTA